MSIEVRLGNRSAKLIEQAQAHETFKLLLQPSLEWDAPEASRVLLRNVLLQSYYFGFHLTEAAFVAIGKFPKSRPNLIGDILDLVKDEVFHPELAGRDFVRMGGDPELIDMRKCSRAAFVMGGTCRMLADHADPLSYLGVIYLMETTTPVLTDKLAHIQDHFEKKSSSKFIPLHAKEDIAHAKQIDQIVKNAASYFPNSEQAIEFGFDCLAQVYPGPIWCEALRRTRAELASASNLPERL